MARAKSKTEAVKQLEVLAADGIQENEKAEAAELVKDLEALDAVEDIVIAEAVSDGVAIKDIDAANVLDDVLVGYEYRVSEALKNIIDTEYNWQASETIVNGKDIDAVATVKYWLRQGHTGRNVVAV